MSGLEDIASEDVHWLNLRATQRTADLFDRLNLFFGHAMRLAPSPAYTIRIPKNVAFEEYVSFPSNHMLYDIGAFSYSESAVTTLKVGRYCSIAAHLQVMGERHPMERVTSSSFTYCFRENWNKPQFLRAHRTLFSGTYTPGQVKQPAIPVLKHDVWIGQNAILARGITLHTGCVVAAGAVVTRDVAPYTIVGGVPARPIRRRFDDALCDRLLATQWWERHPETLFTLGFEDPALFCDRFEAAVAEGSLQPWTPRRLTWRDIKAELERAA